MLELPGGSGKAPPEGSLTRRAAGAGGALHGALTPSVPRGAGAAAAPAQPQGGNSKLRCNT